MSESRVNESLVNYCGTQVSISLEMSQDIGGMDALIYTIVSPMDKIPRMHEHLSELWLVFLNRKLRSASKKKGGLAHQRRLICIGGESTLGLAANGRLGRAPRDIREALGDVIGV